MATWNEVALRSGASGVAAAVLLMAGFPLYFMAGPPPDLGDTDRLTEYLTRNRGLILTSKLVNTVHVAGFLLFLDGLRHLIRRASADHEWEATLVFGAGLVAASATLTGDLLGASAALDTFNALEPAAVCALGEAALPAFGAIGLLMTTLFLVSASYALLVTRALPWWTGWMGYAVAILTTAAIPTLYGSASSGVSSYSTSIAGLAFIAWLLSAGISMMRVKPGADDSRPG